MSSGPCAWTPAWWTRSTAWTSLVREGHGVESRGAFRQLRAQNSVFVNVGAVAQGEDGVRCDARRVCACPPYPHPTHLCFKTERHTGRSVRGM